MLGRLDRGWSPGKHAVRASRTLFRPEIKKTQPSFVSHLDDRNTLQRPIYDLYGVSNHMGALGGAIAQYRTVLTVAPWLKSVPSALSKARQWLRRLSWFLLTLQRALGRLEACGGPSYSPQLAPEGGPLSSHHQAAAMTPWMDRNVVQPYLTPLIEKNKGD